MGHAPGPSFRRSMQPTSQTRSWVLLGGDHRYYGGTNLLDQSRRHRAACWSAPYNRGTRYRLRGTGAVTVPAAASPGDDTSSDRSPLGLRALPSRELARYR